jgi:hypothetical protein
MVQAAKQFGNNQKSYAAVEDQPPALAVALSSSF